jgi:hypothetical protein
VKVILGRAARLSVRNPERLEKQAAWHCHGNFDGVSRAAIVQGMQPISYARHQFPPEIIRHAVWLYLRFTFELR